MKHTFSSPQRWLGVVLFLIIINSLYLWGFVSATIFYVVNILLHIILGVALIPLVILALRQMVRQSSGSVVFWLAGAGFVVATVSGLGLIYFGNFTYNRWLLDTHIVASLIALVAGLVWGWQTGRVQQLPRRGLAAGLAVMMVLATAALWQNGSRKEHYRIENPTLLPETLAGEAMGGAEGPFFPSAAETRDGKLIPANFFLDSQTCGTAGCHTDIVKQWEASAHHFSSFNNQYYRKSIEYMQEVVGTRKPLWCAGCHDPALLFSGQMDQKVSDFLEKPEAHAGIGCVSCHSIVGVKGTMGNGGYIIEYPPLHELLTSDNRLVRAIHDFVLRINPEPHRRAFNKPLHTEQTAEFCSSCHKVHLDTPVNNYRWVRGFNTYDNWQASGVSGQGARSFYYPPKPLDCADCHMPKTPSLDVDGQIRPLASHRFLAANTALPTANLDTTQRSLVEKFLKSRQLSVDIFAVSEAASLPLAGGGGETPVHPGEAPIAASTFAVGEEQGFAVGAGGITRAAGRIVAPLRDGVAAVAANSSVRVDVVVRTRGLGHFFPDGTVDAQEAWLELQAVDSDGRPIFWSGGVLPDGQVEPGAHFYRNFLLDARGNPINKRNAWSARSTLYVNLIPPGAADVAHFRMNIPPDCGDQITLIARVNYRKFNWWHNHWAYAGVRDPGQTDLEVTADYDNGKWLFRGDLTAVSGKLKAVPEIPIVVMAQDTVRLQVVATPEEMDFRDHSEGASDREAWNDYGIGLLRQGDLKGAERAFRKVTELAPDDADGWINLARVYLREGDLTNAEKVLQSAEAVQPGFHKTHFFRGLLHKARAEYDRALTDLLAVAEEYPRDRVVLNQIGRVYYLSSRPAEAIPYFERALQVDPEDLMAHYNLMLCYRAVGNAEASRAHEIRYRRYKADENASAIAEEYRRHHPHDNNESQPIHEHSSMPPELLRMEGYSPRVTAGE